MLKKLTVIAVTTFMIGVGAVYANDKVICYPGAFEAEGSTVKTTTAVAEPAQDGMVKFTFSFKDDKSGPGYAQFPLAAKEDFPALEFSTSVKEKYLAQVWIEDDKGWKLQEKITLKPGDWQKSAIVIKETTATKAKYVRVIFEKKENNVAKGEVLFKAPTFVK